MYLFFRPRETISIFLSLFAFLAASSSTYFFDSSIALATFELWVDPLYFSILALNSSWNFLRSSGSLVDNILDIVSKVWFIIFNSLISISWLLVISLSPGSVNCSLSLAFVDSSFFWASFIIWSSLSTAAADSACSIIESICFLTLSSADL